MYGVFTYMFHKFSLNAGRYTNTLKFGQAAVEVQRVLED